VVAAKVGDEKGEEGLRERSLVLFCPASVQHTR
jgi:hypothetical protein